MKAFAAIVGAAFISCAWLPRTPEPSWNERIPFFTLGSADIKLFDLVDRMHLRLVAGYEPWDNPKIHLPSPRPTWGELNDALRAEGQSLNFETMTVSKRRPYPADGWITSSDPREGAAEFIRWL